MSSVKVFLDNYNGACFPGQTIAGRIECTFDKEKKLRAVRVKFRGRAKTEWTEMHHDHHHTGTGSHFGNDCNSSFHSGFHSDHHSGFHSDHNSGFHSGHHTGSHSRSVRYYAEETYFDAEYNLLQGGENFQLPPGKHVYPFSYILPPQLPSSFEGGSYGNIRFYVKAIVDRPWKFDYEDRFPLNVVSPLDLNYLPGIRNPINTSVDKTFLSCWCNSSGPLTFNLSLPTAGCVAGETLNLQAYVKNMTNVSASNVKFKVVGNVEFISQYPSRRTRYDEIDVAKCLDEGIGAHGEKTWKPSINIPVQHFPNLIPCGIINLTYVLKAEVVVPFPHTNLDNEIPLAIGTVPLSGVDTTYFSGGPPAPMYSTPENVPLLPPAPYPGGDISYPGGIASPYPAGGSAPYPPGGKAPYPPGGSAPYPPGGSAPYPPGGSAPYPPGGSAPYPPSGSAPYPPGGTAPYPPGADAKYAESMASYPPGGAPYSTNSGFSAPSAPAKDSNFELPSYDQANQSKEKN